MAIDINFNIVKGLKYSEDNKFLLIRYDDKIDRIPIEELSKYYILGKTDDGKNFIKKIDDKSINHPPLQLPEDVIEKIDHKKDDIKDEKLADYKITYQPKIDATKVDIDRVKIVGTKSLLDEYMELLYWSK